MVASFDDKYLMTTGSRGGFFSFRMRYDELEKHAQAAADGRAKELAAQAAKAALVSTATVTAELDASMDEVFGKKNWEEEGRTGWKNWKEELEERTQAVLDIIYLTPFDFVLPLSFSTHSLSLSLSLRQRHFKCAG